MPLGEVPHNAQIKPPEWDGLVEIAANSLIEELPYDQQHLAAQQVWEATYDLGVEDREANRYYGHGLVACTLAQSLASPKAERRMVTNAADRLVKPVLTGGWSVRDVDEPHLTVK